MDNIIDLESEIHKAFSIKCRCLAVFFDITRAFDDFITQKLHSWDIKGLCLSFVQNFLQNQTFRVKANGQISNIMKFDSGLPQG